MTDVTIVEIEADEEIHLTVVEDTELEIVELEMTGPPGRDGVDGEDGQDGQDGQDGSSGSIDVRVMTSSGFIELTDVKVVYTGSGPATLQLRDIVGAWECKIKRANGAGVVTIQADASDTIEGASQISLNNNAAVELFGKNGVLYAS